MAIIGIERIIYHVDDLPTCTAYFTDFGLPLHGESADLVRFDLPNNSRVYLQTAPVPGSEIVGPGVHEVVWGVDTREHFEALVAGIAADRAVRHDDAGIAHFIADGGIAMGLRHWPEKRAVIAPADPINSPGKPQRMNQHRRWIERARPKEINHLGFLAPDRDAIANFLEQRLHFRLSDRQRDFGIYYRADGTFDHHNVAIINSNAGLPGMDGQLRFHHAMFLVTDVDEIMAGKIWLERRGWEKSEQGLGRHRIASALFCYFNCPAGGEAEYGADSDLLDDSWVPRDFDPMTGLAHWIHNAPDWWRGGRWDVQFVEGRVPQIGGPDARAGLNKD